MRCGFKGLEHSMTAWDPLLKRLVDSNASSKWE
ncbi:hypothetical protein BvCmsKKNP014_02643 [Escherichia coli]|nr:hypothetical protein BvCmsKKNP014_02643 [Escherichia coli]